MPQLSQEAKTRGRAKPSDADCIAMIAEVARRRWVLKRLQKS
jgi:hypothetical protein